ncbi:MAG: MFS transporter [Alphaproteobacteria bacterium]|nr:MFS transporter [Alphaproteobacteria bacterium]
MSIKSMPRSVVVLGFVSMFMDISSEMIHGLLPVFMVSVLSVSALSVGIIEGIAEATASITKIFSGVVSDWIGKRKPLVLLGYGMAALTKPLFPLAEGIGAILTARFIDRIGKGIRGAPRDALITDLVPKTLHGAAFGLRQSMDTIGAFVGPAIAMALMFYSLDNYRMVFWLAVIPAFIAVACIIFGVEEPEKKPAGKSKPFPIQKSELVKLQKPFWLVVAFAAAFTLARFSEAFLLLRADNLGLAAGLTPAILITMNIVYAGSAYPIGKLSDRIGRFALLAGGIFLLIVADLLLAFGDNLYWVFAGSALWGLHMGMTQGLLAALVADTAPAELRGTAFGMFHLLTGVILLIASALAGWLWMVHGPAETFLAGAVFAGISLAGFALLRGKYLK